MGGRHGFGYRSRSSFGMGKHRDERDRSIDVLFILGLGGNEELEVIYLHTVTHGFHMKLVVVE